MKQSWIFSVKHRLFLLSLVLLSACSSVPNNAPVVERSKDVPAEVIKAVPEVSAKNVEPRPSYIVKRGDTLSRIAIDQGVNVNDLIAWNNLKNPSDIKVDQVLWVGSPDGSGVKISPVTNNSGIEVRNLNPINPATNKTAPKGEKRPYSEANLAELQKADNSAGVVLAAKSDMPAAKPLEKVTATAAPTVETIEWIWPANGKVLATFDDPKNKGIDIGGKLGQDVVAVAPGKVIYEVGAVRGYGNMLVITHANNYLSVYAHNKANLVKKGQTVSKGQKIAEMGNSDSETVKLHFEIRQAGKPVDPLKLLPTR
ncbi:peptidoglycan DD-metalloendopeptidase family protein [Undibacterium flavidum]|uniref:Peptidoglycan DD-metalloendopeptidase family protein n=1 Tax=Undibacterium flavidum TaxID=2762297 RepID=A0ABR6Y6M2_9BURK|nr:peptidoglycan DD-metalloendopeptidase family protein [Undibacterium flavidum]MBC3872262.1 peptidoglycan DD-metalloendopeptidase family protein [Undibacterium flavidum]